MKVGKKALSLVLSLSILLGTLISNAAFAASPDMWDSNFDSGYQDSAISYRITDSNFTPPKDCGEVKAVKVQSTSGRVEIPAQVVSKKDGDFCGKKFNVTVVDTDAFKDVSASKADASIYRPDTLKIMHVQLNAEANGYVALEAQRMGQVTAKAIPVSGYRLGGWYSGSQCVSLCADYTLPQDKDYSLIAKFVPVQVTATIDYADYNDGYKGYYDNKLDSCPMGLDENVMFTWKDAPQGEALTWSSTQPSVAKVDPKTGVVIPQKLGRTFIKALSASGSAVYFKVTVCTTAPARAGTNYVLKKVSFDYNSQIIPKMNNFDYNGSFLPNLTYSYTRSDGKTEEVTTFDQKNDETISFSSSDSSVFEARLAMDGDVMVWAKRPGTAVITATVSDKDGQTLMSAKTTVTVPDLDKYQNVEYSFDGTFSDQKTLQCSAGLVQSNKSADFNCDLLPNPPADCASVYFKVPCDANQDYHFEVLNSWGEMLDPEVSYNKSSGTAIFKIPTKFLQKATDIRLSADGWSWNFGTQKDNIAVEPSVPPVGVYKNNGNTVEIKADGSLCYDGVSVPIITDFNSENQHCVDQGYGCYDLCAQYHYFMDRNGGVTFDYVDLDVPNAAGIHWDTNREYLIYSLLQYDASTKTLTDTGSDAVYTLGTVDTQTKAVQNAINSLTSISTKEQVMKVVSQVRALSASERNDLGTDVTQTLEGYLETALGTHPTIPAPTVPSTIPENERISEPPTATGLLLAAGITDTEGTNPTVTLAAVQKPVSSLTLPSTISANDAKLAFDLTLTRDGKVIHDLDVPIEVTFTFPDSLDDPAYIGPGYQILHQKADGSYELLSLAISGNIGRFVTSSLSTFTVVPADAVLPGGNNGGNNNGGNSGGSGHSGSGHSSPSSLLSTPSTTATFVSDTTTDFSVKGTYQFKITSTNGQIPTLVIGTAGVFNTQFVKVDGNDYYFKLVAVGAPGAKAGIYVNGVKLLVAKVGTTVSMVRSDTTLPFNIRKGATYLMKLTADAKPVLTAGSGAAFRIELIKAAGKNYYFRITATGAAGSISGLYINAEKTPVTVATISK